MLLAEKNGMRLSPAPGITDATCPICGAEVQAKCGQINVWHWAHKNLADCDPWAEPDSLWHRSWQSEVPAARREVVIGNHRADIVTADGTVVEIQHSTISAEEIHAREAHYGNMIWIFDAVGHATTQPGAQPWDARLDLRTQFGKPHTYRTFRWKHARRSISACRRPVILDLGDGRVLSIGRIYFSGRCGGWGKLLSRAELAATFNKAAS